MRTELSPWRVEWLRLVRTRRLIALAGVFVLLGFAEPLGTYYLPELLRHSNAKGIKITRATAGSRRRHQRLCE